MVRKWEAMNYLQKFGKISMLSLLMAVPSVAFANTVVTSQTYVDMEVGKKLDKDQGSTNAGKVLVVGNDGIVTTAASNTIGDANVIEHIQAAGTELNITNKTVNIPEMSGATANTTGKWGLVPAARAGDQAKVLSAAGTWVEQPTVNDGTLTIQQNGTSKGTFTANSSTSPTVNIEADKNVIEKVKLNGTALAVDSTDKSVNVPVMGGATANAAGTTGLVPASSAGDQAKFLKADGTWATPTDEDTKYTASNGVTLTGTNFTNSGVRAVATGTAAGTISVNTNGTTADVAVNGFADKQTKPASGVANGKVLTYTGTDANANVSAAYVTVPVAAGAPSTNTPTAFAEVWVQ